MKNKIILLACMISFICITKTKAIAASPPMKEQSRIEYEKWMTLSFPKISNDAILKFYEARGYKDKSPNDFFISTYDKREHKFNYKIDNCFPKLSIVIGKDYDDYDNVFPLLYWDTSLDSFVIAFTKNLHHPKEELLPIIEEVKKLGYPISNAQTQLTRLVKLIQYPISELFLSESDGIGRQLALLHKGANSSWVYLRKEDVFSKNKDYEINLDVQGNYSGLTSIQTINIGFIRETTFYFSAPTPDKVPSQDDKSINTKIITPLSDEDYQGFKRIIEECGFTFIDLDK